MQVVPTQCYPLVKRFLKSNQFSKSAQQFEKETKSEIEELKKPSLEEILSFWLEHHPKDINKFTKEDDEEENADKKKKDKKSNKLESKKRKQVEEEEEEEEQVEKKKDKKKKQKMETKEESEDEKELTKKEKKKAEKEEKEAKKLEKKKEKKEKRKEKKTKDDDDEEKEVKKESKKKQIEEEEEEEPMKVTNPLKQNQEGTNEETFNQNNNKGSKKNTPFKRISEDYYVGQEFRDNTFESKKGDVFGAKANAILSQVRGKGFRHEKTKKKRGTYSGGQIDMGVNSIKFENSDDE